MGASISGSLVTGQNNVILGAAADLDSDRSNCIVIGPNAITSASIVAPIYLLVILLIIWLVLLQLLHGQLVHYQLYL